MKIMYVLFFFIGSISCSFVWIITRYIYCSYLRRNLLRSTAIVLLALVSIKHALNAYLSNVLNVDYLY